MCIKRFKHASAPWVLSLIGCLFIYLFEREESQIHRVLIYWFTPQAAQKQLLLPSHCALHPCEGSVCVTVEPPLEPRGKSLLTVCASAPAAQASFHVQPSCEDRQLWKWLWYLLAEQRLVFEESWCGKTSQLTSSSAFWENGNLVLNFKNSILIPLLPEGFIKKGQTCRSITGLADLNTACFGMICELKMGFTFLNRKKKMDTYDLWKLYEIQITEFMSSFIGTQPCPVVYCYLLLPVTTAGGALWWGVFHNTRQICSRR